MPFIRIGHKYLARHSKRRKEAGRGLRKRWQNIIREWTGLGVDESQRADKYGGN